MVRGRRELVAEGQRRTEVDQELVGEEGGGRREGREVMDLWIQR